MDTVTFDQNLKQFILESFGKSVDKEGFILEKDHPTQRVLAPDGEEVRLEQFAGIKKGSEVYIKSDLISLMQLCDDLSK